MAFAKLVEEAGFPSGVFNFVFGPPSVAEYLCSHPGVSMITFTGSAAIGTRVLGLAAPTIKKVVLELGGKSAEILLPGTDVKALASPTVTGWAMNAGQGCGCLTRTLVHKRDFDAYLSAATDTAKSIGCGDPRDFSTICGPLITAEHRSSVAGYVERAVQKGGTVAAGGGGPADRERGFYYEPTIVFDVDNDSEIAQEELFGPVGIVLPYEDIDEAIAMANDSRYGLAGSVWGPATEAFNVARRLHVGTVTVNGGGNGMTADQPWGGYKMSGLGREGGVLGLAEYFESKHIVSGA
jgi:aldehyde dehydrogenase (NAD+)/betaine-aldehyde dehydrogenase